VQPGAGIVYYLKIHRPGGIQRVIGAGVATCAMQPGDRPTAHRAHDHLWEDFEPAWGDVGICINAQDAHIYAFGHGTSHAPDLTSRTFLCKVPAAHALERAAYRYWDNAARVWTPTRFGDGRPGTVRHVPAMAIFDWHAMNQSAPFWSDWLNCWMFLHSTGWPDSNVLCKTAERLEGPWEEWGEVATTRPEGHGDGMRYAVTAHPEFDGSGRTVLVTWTRNNVIWGVTIEWE
jgi:hypothetical protein